MSTRDLPNADAYASLPCQVAAVVPTGDSPGAWNTRILTEGGVDIRKLARFSQYAVAAAKEALKDAGFSGQRFDDKVAEKIVCSRQISTQEIGP